MSLCTGCVRGSLELHETRATAVFQGDKTWHGCKVRLDVPARLVWQNLAEQGVDNCSIFALIRARFLYTTTAPAGARPGCGSLFIWVLSGRTAPPAAAARRPEEQSYLIKNTKIISRTPAGAVVV